jgi:alpha-L-rhamnosidase
MKVAIPANTTATVRLPALDAAKVTEGGRALGDSPGIKQIGQDPSHLLLQVESGSFEFRSTY